MSTLKPIFGVAVFAACVYLIWMLVPPFFHNWQFQDFVEQSAKENTYAYNRSEDQVRQIVFKEAQSDNIPLTSPDQIQVTKTGTTCSISVQYTVHVDLPIFPQDFHFTAASANKNIVY
jgi:hypothetical protein